MAHSRGSFATALILFTLEIVTPAKNNARPVYEVINEQARMDDIRLSSAPAILPYGNPLAGNSAQNARLHASNQQAMFNAERIRQHKAQLQRLTQGPPLIDSYMKAYHESQESHQKALEEQQATVKEVAATTPATNLRKPIRSRPTQHRQRTSIRDRSKIQRQEVKSRTISEEPEKITRANSVSERSRNHRSYGSVEYDQYLQSKLPLAYLTATASDQGVTIKPNGNAGIAYEQKPGNLHTAVISSSSKYLPKNYHSVTGINALESILRKEPTEQLAEFQTLINADKSHDDFQYPLKDLPEDHNPKYYNDAFDQIPSTYASAYSVKDHTPITEEIDDIETPTPYQNTFLIPQVTTIAPLSMVTNSYYKVEVASQTISNVLKPNKINEELYLTQDQNNNNENIGESYINYPDGVQHLAEDGTGVSAYGDENLLYAANYEFGYRVRDPASGNYFGQYEAKTGEKTSGHYHVLLPDGRMQKVQYSAGPSGYHADISYDHLAS